MDFDFCQVLYTAIDEIYSFRLRQEKILLLTQEISENSTIEVPGRPALKSTAPFQEEPITLVMARPARSSTIIKPGFKAAVALESYTASVLRESPLLGPRAAFRLRLVPHHAPTVYWREIFRHITALVTARNSLSPKFESHKLFNPNARHDDMHLLYQRIKTCQPWELVACRPTEEQTYLPCHQSIIG